MTVLVQNRLMQTLIGSALLIGFSGISPAQAQSCQELWVERNGYYKDAGYCFKTRRAIEYFGNGGCRYDFAEDLPMSSSVRNRIEQLKIMERRLGCN